MNLELKNCKYNLTNRYQLLNYVNVQFVYYVKSPILILICNCYLYKKFGNWPNGYQLNYNFKSLLFYLYIQFKL